MCSSLFHFIFTALSTETPSLLAAPEPFTTAFLPSSWPSFQHFSTCYLFVSPAPLPAAPSLVWPSFHTCCTCPPLVPRSASLLSHLPAVILPVCPLFICLPSTFFSKPPRTCLLGFLYLSLTCSSPVPVSLALHLFLVFRFSAHPPFTRTSPSALPVLLHPHFSLILLSPVSHLSLTCPSPAHCLLLSQFF